MQGLPQFARRRKLLAGLVSGALTVTLLVVVVAFWWSNQRDEPPPTAARSIPQDVQQQLSGYTFTRSDEGRQVFTIHAARTVAFKEGGTTVLEDVYVELFGREGQRHDVLRTRRCDYNTKSGDLFSAGTVQIELNAEPAGSRRGAKAQRSVMLETSQLRFVQRGALVESDEPVRFRVGDVSGSARGITYATRDGWLELKHEIHAELQREGTGLPPLNLHAARARYDKEKGQVMLSGPVTIAQGSRRVEAENATVYVDSRYRVQRAVLEGSVRATRGSDPLQMRAAANRVTAEFDTESEELRRGVAEGNILVESWRAGSVSQLSAQMLEVALSGKPSRARQGTASGGVRISQESQPGTRPASSQAATPGSVARSGKELTADAVQFTFNQQGRSLEDAATVGPGRLVLVSPDPKAGERVVTAGQFLISFSANSQLETIRGEGGTSITFQPPKNVPPGAAPQVSTADRLVAVIDPATQTVKALDQIGNFQFHEGDRRATAERASYETLAEKLTLSGKPVLWDAEMRARADRVAVDLRTDKVEGAGKVQSTHFGNGSRGDPTTVLADRVVAERDSQTVHYEGHVRAWQGSDVVESTSLDILRKERRVSSGMNVMTSHLQAAAVVGGAGTANDGSGTRPVTIRAERLEYSDQGRKATYQGNVRLQTENTTLESDRLDAYFSNRPGDGRMELRRAVAEGDVKVTQPGRRATGRQAEYISTDGKIVLSGGPPTVYDAERGFTSGRSLTFFSRDDRLVVSGGDESPTISRHRIEQ